MKAALVALAFSILISSSPAQALVSRSLVLAQGTEAPAASPDLSILSQPTPAAPTPPTLGVQAASDAEASPTFDRTQAMKAYSTVRDPFKQPVMISTDEAPKSPLELFPVDQMRVIGILTGPKRMRAILRLPDGQTHIVTDRMKIGQRNGIIQNVTPKGVRVVEKIVNIIGEQEVFETDIPIQDSAANSATNPEG